MRPIVIAADEVPDGTPRASFPVLVQILDDAELRSVANGGHVASDAGFDITFADASSTLDHEVELYDPVAGSLRAWVRIPSLPGDSDTVFRMDYGTPTGVSQEDAAAVWSGHRGVWHMEEDPSGTAPQTRDSTSAVNHGTSVGSMPSSALVGGISGKAVRFDGSDDKIVIGDEAELVITGAISIEVWIALDVSAGSQSAFARVVDKWSGTFGGGYGLFFSNSGQDFGLNTADGSNQENVIGNPSLSQDVWYYVASTWTPGAGTGRLLVDGNVDTSVSTSHSSIKADNQPFTLGRSDDGGIDACPFRGRIDEVRVSAVSRPPEWFATVNATIRNPSTFCAVGAELPVP